MNTGMHEFEMRDNGQNTSMAYPGPMTDGAVGHDSLFRIMWRGRWLILLSIVAGLAGAYLYLQRATPLYVSTSLILVDKPGSLPRSDVPQPVGSTSSNYLQTQASMIRSREIIAAALSDPNVLTLPTLRNIDYPVEEVLRTLSASVGKNTDIVSVAAQSAYPEDAAQIVNAVVRAYVRWHDANRQLSTADLLKDLNGQLQKHYQELRTKRQERMMFEQRNPGVVDSVRGGIVSKTLELLKQDLASARLNTIQQDSYYEGLKRFETEPNKLQQYIYGRRDSTAVPVYEGERTNLEKELVATRLQLEEISAIGGVSHSRITLLQNRETELQKKIAQLEGEFVQSQVSLAKALSEDAHAREKQLTDMYEKEFAKVQNLSGQDAEYAFIVSECEMFESLCDSILKQINALDLNARFEGLNIHVLEKAVPAADPSSPQALRIMAIGLVLGLMVGAGLALIRDWREQRVRSADEITAILGVPVLGAVPSMSKRGVVTHGQRLRFASNSRESEAYRAIRTALFFGARREQAITILVTSPARLEGKTTLVSNLGIAMAQAGQKTLIIDADLRKPMQHQVFSIKEHDQGLTGVLSGTATLEEAIRHTEVQGLDVLAGGQSAPNPSELLNSQAFANMLEQLKGKYARILVDSPPVGVLTDAQILAAHCGLTLLVLRAEKSTRIPTQRARDALLTVGARLAGVVVNDVPKRNSRYSQSNYSFYGYHYGDQGSDGGKVAGKELPENGQRLWPIALASTLAARSQANKYPRIEINVKRAPTCVRRADGNPPAQRPSAGP
jgi:capsular exopolysaccharide synthesis family protein